MTKSHYFIFYDESTLQLIYVGMNGRTNYEGVEQEGRGLFTFW
jgi:hypothetical protein